MRILVTGVAGFIGFHLTNRLLDQGFKVVGLDNLNSYYNPALKKDRLKNISFHKNKKNFKFIRGDITQEQVFKKIFTKYKFKSVIHLAAQAGVRYSLTHPHIYVKSNIMGFFHLLENVKKQKIKLIFASSSSVYGNNKKKLFVENQNCNTPKQIYAATKISNESMAYAYHELFNLQIVGLRFFTVYGPYGRPDMSIFKFTERILKRKNLEVYNFGKHSRDFTYVDDIVDGILKILKKKYKPSFEIFNLGNNRPVTLKFLIKTISKNLNIEPKIKYLGRQKGDMLFTRASITKAKKFFNYSPKTKLAEGIKKFINWYKSYYKVS